MKVLITSNSFGQFSPAPKNKLLAAGFDILENPVGRMLTEDEMLHYCRDVDAVILSTETMNKRVIDHALKLKVISRYGVGTDNIDHAYCAQKNIAVTVTQNGNTHAVAEYTVGLILASCRKIIAADRYAKQAIWRKFTGLDLTNKTMGIIGLGAIGKCVIKKLQGFNTTILAYDKYYDDDFISQYHVQATTLNDLLKNSDIISLHIPAMTSQPLLSFSEFLLMKQDIVLINTARASLIDKHALLQNLTSKKIFAYAADVHQNEPELDADLFQFDNVILTPHNAAVSREAVNLMSMLAVNNILEHI